MVVRVRDAEDAGALESASGGSVTMIGNAFAFPRIRFPLASTLAIALLGALASIALWHEVDRRQSARIERNAAAFANMLAKMIQVRIDEHELSALRRWVASWAQQESIDSVAWRAQAKDFLSEHRAFAAIVRIDRGRARDVVGAADGSAAVRELIEQIEQRPLDGSPGDSALGPIRLPDGRAAIAVPIPFRGAGGDTGLLFALLEPDVALSRILELGAMGYSVRVVYGNEDLLEANDRALPAADRFWRSQPVVLSTGTPLTVGVHPTALVASSLDGASPLLALSAGLALSGLAAAFFHARGRRLAAPPAIATDVASRRAQPLACDAREIDRLRQELETRVSERTTAFRQTIEELERMNLSVSHDLRSPLGAVINYATILAEDYGRGLDAPANEYLRRIASNAKSAVSLMDGLLAFSQSGREVMHKTHVDMRRLVENVRDDLIGTRGSTRGSIEIADLPDAYADPGMMRRVYTNLISNAWKFVEPGAAPRVVIGGKRNAGELIYFVRDRGLGFDMHASDRLFNVFERLHASAFEGHGVGLAIVARLVRRHGGRVWAHGTRGKGATFLFSLPLPPPEPLDLHEALAAGNRDAARSA